MLTQVWFPWRYFAYADWYHLAGVVFARDLVLVVLLVVLVFRSGPCAGRRVQALLVDLDAHGRARRRAAVRRALDEHALDAHVAASPARAGSACR